MISDDTSVAILEKHDQQFAKTRDAPTATLHFHEKVTSNSSQFAGIHPIVAQDSHQRNLANLVAEALSSLPSVGEGQGKSATQARTEQHATNEIFPGPGIYVYSEGHYVLKKRPDFISVTRGPGLRSCLATGLDTAKGYVFKAICSFFRGFCTRKIC